MRNMFGVVALFVSNLTMADELTFPVEIEKEKAQANIEKVFPVERKTYWVTATISKPVLHLNPEQQRLGLFVDVNVLLPGMVKGEGRGLLDGEPVYRPTEGAFYLNDPKVSQLKIEGLQPSYQPTVEKFVSVMVNELLQDVPIYTLDDKDLRQRLAKSRLRSIEIDSDKLIFQMALM